VTAESAHVAALVVRAEEVDECLMERPEMVRCRVLALGLGALLGLGAAAMAQGPPPLPGSSTPAPSAIGDGVPPFAGAPAPPAGAVGPGTGLEPQSLPAEINEDLLGASSQFRFGPTPVSEVGILMDSFGFRDFFGASGYRVFGWVEQGYNGASTRPGLMSVQTRLPRFADEYLFNELGLVLQKPLRTDEFDWGIFVRYFAGANAAVGQPLGGIGSTITNERFSHDFRDLYLEAHLPILTEGGLDVRVGRMNTIIGYNGFLAPYRPFYTNDYQFFYLQDGAFTGFLTNLHLTDRLEFWNGMTLGANTFFVTRGADSYCYIGQVNYWLTDERKTRLTGSVYLGPDALFSAPALNGTFDSMVELRLQQNWSDRFTQVVQCNMGWDANTPVGDSEAYGIYTQGMFHLTRTFDLNIRGEWFQDTQGTRTGFAADYSEVTLGVNWHPTRCLEIRPEIRGDFASEPAFGGGGGGGNFSQLTGGISAVVKF
jgi:hypothetical protein